MSKYKRQTVPVSFSQNFLTSRKAIERIINLSDINKYDTVLEIGPGKGHITQILLEKSGFVNAPEIDTKLYNNLRIKFSNNKKLNLINCDFLKLSLPKNEYKVFSNIPFFITTAIMKKLTEDNNPPQKAWLVMEKGAAKRFCGKPIDSLQSLLLKPFFDLKILYYFENNDFHPAPRVNTVMLQIAKKTAPDLTLDEQKAFYNFVTTIYKKGFKGLLTKKQINTALRMENLEQIKPWGEILYIQWLYLFRCWRKYGK